MYFSFLIIIIVFMLRINSYILNEPYICNNKRKILMNITDTCCTPHGWAWWGCWGCPRASWSPENHFKSICFWIIGYQHLPCQFLVNITGNCFTPHGWAWQGRWGCPRSPCITLGPFYIDLSFKNSILTCVMSIFNKHNCFLLYLP